MKNDEAGLSNYSHLQRLSAAKLQSRENADNSRESTELCPSDGWSILEKLRLMRHFIIISRTFSENHLFTSYETTKRRVDLVDNRSVIFYLTLFCIINIIFFFFFSIQKLKK